MKKILILILCNIITFCLIIFASDLIIYKKYAANFYKTHPLIYSVNEFKYMASLPSYLCDLEHYFNGENNLYYGRLPDGTNYKTEPVVLFGCSYAFGRHLENNQIFSYKLANIIKRPIYNRAISGGSFQHMYMQTISESFYKQVPKSDKIIYIMINDHYRRSLVRYFEVLDLYILPHFTIHKNRLYEYNYKNHILNFIYSLYSAKYLDHIITENFIKNEKASDKLTDMAVLYFTQSRNELENHWNNKVNFYIILYEDWDIRYKEKLKQKLEKEGFTVISTKELTNEDLKNEKWQMQDNHHPTEAAWNLLTPKIIERLNLK